MEKLAILLLCLAFPVRASPQTDITWTCATDQHLCHRKGQQWSGWYVDTIGPLLEQCSELTINYDVLPVKRMYKYLNSEPIKFSVLPINKKIYPHFLFGKKALSFGQIALFSPNKVDPFDGLEKLPPSRIALRRGMTYNGIREKLDQMPNKMKLVIVNNNKNIFRLLEKKRADYVLLYLTPGVVPLHRAHPHIVLQEVEFHFAISAKFANAASTLDKLDDAIDCAYKLQNLKHYFPPQDEYYRQSLEQPALH